nr:glycosyltransferase family 4 protein [Synechococcus sp. 1G10]
MRILLVSQEYPLPAGHGGIASQTRLKALGLARLGHEVTVLTQSPDHNHHEFQDEMVRVVRMPGGHDRLALATLAATWIATSMAVAEEIQRLHQARPIDLIDFAEYGGEGYLHLLNRAPWNAIVTVLQLHGPVGMLSATIGWPEPGSCDAEVGQAMEAICLRLADVVYSSSQCSAIWAERLYGRDASTIPVLHAGIDVEAFCPSAGPRSECPTVVFVGRVAASKGADRLMEAVAMLRANHPELRLRMIGRVEPAMADQLRQRAASTGSPAWLELMGPLDHTALPMALAGADLFAAPSRYEGGPGFVYLEAMACGLPVIACEGSGAAEAIENGVDGLLVPPDDTDVLIEALDSLLRDPSRRRAMGERGRQRVLAEADTRRCVPAIATFYAEVLAAAKR